MQRLLGRDPFGGVHRQEFLQLDKKMERMLYSEPFGPGSETKILRTLLTFHYDAHQQEDFAVGFYFMLLHVFDEAAVGVAVQHKGAGRENFS